MFQLVGIFLFFILTFSAQADWKRENLSFNFSSQSLPLKSSIVVDEMIKLESFEAPGENRFLPVPEFRLIMGYGSDSIFDALGVEEIAGLKKQDALVFIEKRKLEGKSEADGAFIAGLTNIHGRQIFMFFNLNRLNSSLPYAMRVLAHEPLHLARFLITTMENPKVDYYQDPYTELNDDNEEFFAEMLERLFTIAHNRYTSNQQPIVKNLPAIQKTNNQIK